MINSVTILYHTFALNTFYTLNTKYNSRSQYSTCFITPVFVCVAFQTEGKLYLILDFLRGGDLFTRLSKEVRLLLIGSLALFPSPLRTNYKPLLFKVYYRLYNTNAASPGVNIPALTPPVDPHLCYFPSDASACQ